MTSLPARSSLNFFQSPPASRAIPAMSPWKAGISICRGGVGRAIATAFGISLSSSAPPTFWSTTGRFSGAFQRAAASSSAFWCSAFFALSLSGRHLPFTSLAGRCSSGKSPFAGASTLRITSI